MIQSKINPVLTLDYMTTNPENKYFDRKSAQKKPSEISNLISAFANAEGGTIVIGISDKNKKIEGINKFGEDKINGFINAPKDFCKPMPMYKDEFLSVTNYRGEDDRILLLHIHSSIDQIIRTNNDSTYLRIGDKTREIKGDELRNLEYSKSTRHYEDECNMDAKIDDLDNDLIEEYKKILNADNLPTEQVLSARGFLKTNNNKKLLTNAAVLLFAKNINQFYPNCRIRFIRYDGNSAQVGTRINIIKDVELEYPILRLIDKTKEFILSQLREFTALNKKTGKFQTIPEYPEFAWLEGIVNAITHREYGMSGNYIKITMFNDRLEIQSPGKLPNLVTIENIKETRYSRNPRIARVLTSFGWVRELNEGVKRIYSDMKEFFLEEPVYTEPDQTVNLVLKNNIEARTIRTAEGIGHVWEQLDKLEKDILVYMVSQKAVTCSNLTQQVKKSKRTVLNRLNKLIELNIVQINGNKHDPHHTYSISNNKEP